MRVTARAGLLLALGANCKGMTEGSEEHHSGRVRQRHVARV